MKTRAKPGWKVAIVKGALDTPYTDQHGRRVTQVVREEFSNASKGEEPFVLRMERQALGSYRTINANVTISGKRTVRVEARITDFDKVVFTTEMLVH